MMPAMWTEATAHKKMVHCCSGVRRLKCPRNMLPSRRHRSQQFELDNWFHVGHLWRTKRGVSLEISIGLHFLHSMTFSPLRPSRLSQKTTKPCSCWTEGLPSDFLLILLHIRSIIRQQKVTTNHFIAYFESSLLFNDQFSNARNFF